MTQSQALSILKTGANVFLSGEPGSGKTHVINEYAKYLRDRNIEPAITASTGIAATHIGGLTIHSWSGIGIKRNLNKYDLDRISSSEYIVKRVKRSSVLIIDEISMLSAQTLSMIDTVCKEIKADQKPFGGMQIVFVGDFFQLPPVNPVRSSREALNPAFAKTGQHSSPRQATGRYASNWVNKKCADDSENVISLADPTRPASLDVRFAYDSSAFKNTNPLICYLTEQHRQDDDGFLSVLSAIRQNFFDQKHLSQIEERKIEITKTPPGAPKLYSHNADVDRINNEMLDKLSGDARQFEMFSSGSKKLVQSLKKGCLSPENLFLKKGAKVMFTKNNPKEKFVNGTLGEVTGFDEGSRYPVVEKRNGQKIIVKPMEWSVEENGKIRATITQLPLRLAWAITVHKSQGMNLDEAIMDLTGVFEYGQGYVALSRVKRFSGLYLIGWNPRAFQVHPDVLEKDESFRKESENAEITFGKMSVEELGNMHENFISSCGGKRSPKAKSSIQKKYAAAPTIGENFAKIRETHPNAYRPWNTEQDEKLTKLFGEGQEFKDMAKEFGRKIGAIRARLLKLKLIE